MGNWPDHFYRYTFLRICSSVTTVTLTRCERCPDAERVYFGLRSLTPPILSSGTCINEEHLWISGGRGEFRKYVLKTRLSDELLKPTGRGPDVLEATPNAQRTLCCRLTMTHQHIHLPCPPAAVAVQNIEFQQNKYSYYYFVLLFSPQSSSLLSGRC